MAVVERDVLWNRTSSIIELTLQTNSNGCQFDRFRELKEVLTIVAERIVVGV